MRPTRLWTNAHVVRSLKTNVDQLAEAGANPERFIVRAGTEIGGSETYGIVGEGEVHPDYDGTTTSEDVGLLRIDGSWDVGLGLLPRDMVDDLDIGQPVGTLGFPGELGATGRDARLTVTPTFKDGVVSALRLIDGGEAPHVEVQYNFDATGGTSGSPVFDHNGWVVAVNFAGIETRAPNVDGVPVRIGLGSLDFGIRVDEVWDLIAHLEPGGDQPVAATVYPRRYSGSYRPFPENWNGETVYEP